MAEDLSLADATTKLEAHGGYDWLLRSNQQFWSPLQVAEALKNVGLEFADTTIIKWFRSTPHHQDFGGRGGLRASKNDLIIFFASRMPS
jgi:hypothetical protein